MPPPQTLEIWRALHEFHQRGDGTSLACCYLIWALLILGHIDWVVTMTIGVEWGLCSHLGLRYLPSKSITSTHKANQALIDKSKQRCCQFYKFPVFITYFSETAYCNLLKKKTNNLFNLTWESDSASENTHVENGRLRGCRFTICILICSDNKIICICPGCGVEHF